MNPSGEYEPTILRLKGWKKALRYVLLGVISILFLAPVFWMISSALKPDYQVFAIPPIWWPDPPRWSNFRESLTSLPFGRFAINTLIIATGSVIGHLLSCSIVAYGFARLEAPGKGFWFIVLVSTLMLPYPVTMVPLYILFSKLGWINSFLPLVVPTFFGNAFYIFLLRQSFKQVPAELEDAARIDGASFFQILGYVILPISSPALATVAIFSFQAAWNDFLAPLIFLHDQSKYTLQLGLSFFRGSYTVNWPYLMAASLVVTIPVILIYFFFQRAFIEGIGFTGTKL
ncbi:MAG: carbohydrate ABC transporter permease [Anaerolineales bacterium]|jgi:ABC-type glycerol-3-phosphate transport system permease component|nr:carbohydrate ABC transporter permease [Anaerolineales bacterium]